MAKPKLKLGKFVAIENRLKGTFSNKMQENELGQRGLDVTRYIRTLGFLLRYLDFQQFNCLVKEFDANELGYYFNSLGEIIQEFSDEAGLMIDILDDLRKQGNKTKASEVKNNEK